MTIFRAPLANDKGEVMLSMQASGVVPAGATEFRGLWVTINGLIGATNDTGQARKYVGGFALEDPSGLLLVTETAPVSVPMDGINANVAGAVVTKTGAGSLIHQGVAMTVSAPGGPIVVNKDEPPLTFYASLERGINSAKIEGVGTRDSQATYWAEDGTLRIAEVNEIRQEFQNGQPLGTLMEPASTNKCENYNANPDAALTNLTLAGEPAATMERALDVQKLQDAGLLNVCSSGYVVKVVNPGPSTARVDVAGLVGNLNPHAVSMYWRGEESGDRGGIRLSQTGTANDQAPFEYERISQVLTPTNTSEVAQILIQPTATLYFVLNQLEEQPVPTSVIVTEGAAASRAVDQLQWSLTDSLGRNILNQTEGMAAITFRPGFAGTDFTTGQYRILRLGTDTSEFMYYTPTGPEAFWNWDGTNLSNAPIAAGLQKDQLDLIALRWEGVTKQIGFKTGGTWVWSTSGSYDGNFNEAGTLDLVPEATTIKAPSHSRELYLWSEDKGTAWLESFFSGVAN